MCFVRVEERENYRRKEASFLSRYEVSRYTPPDYFADQYLEARNLKYYKQKRTCHYTSHYTCHYTISAHPSHMKISTEKPASGEWFWP